MTVVELWHTVIPPPPNRGKNATLGHLILNLHFPYGRHFVRYEWYGWTLLAQTVGSLNCHALSWGIHSAGHLPTKFWGLLIPGLHVTSRQPWCFVGGQKKSISLLWELNPIFCKFFKKKFYRIDHQHTTNMTALSRGCKPRIWVLSKFLITCNSYVRDEWIWLGKKWTV